MGTASTTSRCSCTHVPTQMAGVYSGPQRLLLYTGTTSGAFVLWKKGDTHFMETYPNLMEADGFEQMTIEKKVLTISSTTALSMGSWSAGGCTMKWRHEPAGLRLIGLTVTNVDRKCACGTTTDSNLVTGAVIIESDMNEQGAQTKLTRRKKKTKPTTQLWESFDYERACN